MDIDALLRDNLIGVDAYGGFFNQIGMQGDTWRATSGGNTESGEPAYDFVPSEAARAKANGYNFDFQRQGPANSGTLTAYAPDGSQFGQYQQKDSTLGQDLAQWAALAGAGFGGLGLAGLGPAAGLFGGGAAGGAAGAGGGGAALSGVGADSLASLGAYGATATPGAVTAASLGGLGGFGGAAGAAGAAGAGAAGAAGASGLASFLPTTAGGWAQLGAPILSAGLQSYSAGQAANAQAAASQAAIAANAPYRDAGLNALGQLVNGAGAVPSAQEVMAQPGYQFGLDQGQQAIDRQIAAHGGRNSGAAIKSAAQYGTDYATTKYNDAYNKTQDRMNRLQQLASMGQSGTNAVTNLTVNQGNNAGYSNLAQGSIWGNAANQIGSYYANKP